MTDSISGCTIGWRSSVSTPIIQYPRLPMSTLRHRELRRELAYSRIHLVPLLLAEQDRDAYRRNEAALKREKEIMKDVPGWEVRDGRYRRRRMSADCRSLSFGRPASQFTTRRGTLRPTLSCCKVVHTLWLYCTRPIAWASSHDARSTDLSYHHDLQKKRYTAVGNQRHVNSAGVPSSAVIMP